MECIDHFAFKKRKRYGTIFIDLLTGGILGFLPNRIKDSVKNWLIGHLETQLITRDRAQAYKSAAEEASPNQTGRGQRAYFSAFIRQTFEDIELILVNDGSTDDSLKICEKYKERDKRIVLIDKVNEGSIATRRVGVEAAKSNYIMFVDSDDWIDRSAVNDLYEAIIKSDSDITVCKHVKVIGNQKFIKQEYKSNYFSEEKVLNEEEIKNQLVVAYLHGHPFPSSLYAKLYKKELLLTCGNFLESIKFLGDDLFYNLEIFLKARRVKIINKPLYYYRIGGFTSKYMPYLFEDMVNGYNIQKTVINEYYSDTYQKQSNGISIMLLNTFKTCLNNLFYSELSVDEKMAVIKNYLSNPSLKETLNNQGVRIYFSDEYLMQLRMKK